MLNDIKGVIWYQESLTNENRYTRSTFYVSLNTGIKKNFMLNNADRQAETLKLLEDGLCKEIKRVNWIIKD